MSTDFDFECETAFNESFTGNTLELDLKKCDSEVRADIKVRKKNCVRVWGQIRDCEGEIVKRALVKLLKVCYKHGKVELEGIAHTVTDCMGFYQFEVCNVEEHPKYKIIVSKVSEGRERVIRSEGKCEVCEENECRECRE